LIEDPSGKNRGNPSSGIRADTSGQTDGRTDMTKVTGAIRNYANAPKKKTKNKRKNLKLKMEEEGTRKATGRKDERSE
jgi:hypothetical protein